MLFAGLIVFNLFSEVLTKSTMLIVGQPNFVKKVVFPLELLPVITVFTALVHAFIGIAVWLVGYQLLIGTPKLTILYFPLVLFCFLPVLLGVGWLLSSIGVIFRDISQITSMLNHVLLFLTPIFFSIEAAPPLLQKFLLLNPLTFIVEQFRLILFYGEIPMFNGLAIYFVLATLFAWLSFMLFRRLRPNFANMV
ncbi:ABC-2 [Yersinia mollaretii]|nr:ABC-2 [Yersinia mollaretii]CQQ20943.1 ABC-2 [Yersinia mollaretii]